MTSTEATRAWVAKLFGIPEERQDNARERIASWRIPHLERVLSVGNADGAVASVLLAEAVEVLVEQGTEESKLLAKLRRDPNVWPTWAELRAAGLIARETTAGDSHLLLEPDRSGGRHADFAFAPTEDEPQHSIEFKAIGLSDAEAEFSDRMAPLLPGLLPRQGLLTMHLEDTDVEVVMNRDERRRHRRDAERRVRYLHPQVQPVAAATAVGHGTEQSYVRRLSARFEEAFGQLQSDDVCWVAFHWSNGAPLDMVDRALAAIEVPDHVVGVVLLGAVAIPGSLHNFIVWLIAPFGQEGGSEWHSDTTVEDAQTLWGVVDASAGVRPTLVRVPWQGTMVDFLFRSGSPRIFPFNLVLSPDPEGLVSARGSGD